MKAMILAAGFGRRLRPLTDHTPKPLLVVQGKPLIQHHLEDLAEAGISRVVINHAWLGNKLERALGDGSAFGVSINWSREGQPLETGGGIKRALPLLAAAPGVDATGVFLVISSDVWTDYPFKRLSSTDLGGKLAHLVLVDNPDHHKDGDYQLDKQGVVHIKQGSQTSYTYTGLALISPALFASAEGFDESFPLREVLLPAIKAGQVSGEVYSGVWSDVGTVERLNVLNGL